MILVINWKLLNNGKRIIREVFAEGEVGKVDLNPICLSNRLKKESQLITSNAATNWLSVSGWQDSNLRPPAPNRSLKELKF